MSTHNIDLTGHFDDFLNHLIASGQFPNADEVMRAGLRLLEEQGREQDEKLASLRALAAEGFDELDRGQGIALESDQQLADFISDAGRRAAGCRSARG
jgi:antitoxin ParD1/3/4